MFDLDKALPSRWRKLTGPYGDTDVQAHAPILKLIRDKVRDRYGAMYAARMLPDPDLEALIRSEGMTILASQCAEVEGRAFAVSVQCLINHLCVGGEA